MIAGLLLAAGGARRFGSQKLVRSLGHRPLVTHAAERLAAETESIVVVVGDRADAVRAALDGTTARFVENADWAKGLSTSLRAGILALSPDVEAVVVCLGDQPRVARTTIAEVISRWRGTGSPIVSARYRGVRGHPVLFDRSVFAELVALRGDSGAKMVIEREPSRVGYVEVDAPVPGDVDSPEDLALLEKAELAPPLGDS